ncbi:hypothetical protein A2631_05815 [Candidatus Daviesbacteria bacterium RIFCSPHIGHO2_01_FULL_44_29]|uniref:Uncharacterized protein n=1 Tax=Candidatus Daviesbacteria bacterium RIFCSPHIGHO2_02_FULL_43_12 TaxID=1797776 RepID=A0A1F5KJ46_9BACT|nr:MAG: hypothetical protein A2631_05815 [Candidatus Daviesbacteria bacterium RIFCSPHIGHO2_01_FULL_44_29]OGE40631.1 MAG: hypothetical protein A3D25_05735 [Candidatus Daviesbacteria bacterium RIFCSPHIGHO2_02_FULL_43_12]OGE69872.1 MAG: hypothetical protein A3B55_05690 [Candidatus Daviesbacteria bacterium RIFCSPLOWO2_01_FULL_43_15]
MVTKTIQKQPKSMVELQITVPWADLQSKWTEAVQKLAQETELPGFRKGQAPLEMVEQRSFAQVQQELLRVVMPQALVEALAGSDVVPIDYPQYQIVSFTKGADLVYKARVTQRPGVVVGNYKVVRASRPVIKPVTEEQVDGIIADLFKRWKTKAPHQSAQGSSLPTQTPSPSGSSATGAGSLNFNAPPPQPFSPTEVTSTSDVPDDIFAKAMGGQDLADLRRKIKEDLESESKYNNELDYEENILQEVEKITTVDLPEVLIQDELNRMLVSLQRRVADMGLLLDDYLRGQNKTLEQIKAEWRPQAEKNVRMELGLSEIARMENVNITDADLQAEIDKIQDARLKQQFEQQEPRMHLRHALRQTKTLNLLKEIVK